jgi:hypothetical protein
MVVFSAAATRAREPWGNDPSHNMVLEAEDLPIHFKEDT